MRMFLPASGGARGSMVVCALTLLSNAGCSGEGNDVTAGGAGSGPQAGTSGSSAGTGSGGRADQPSGTAGGFTVGPVILDPVPGPSNDDAGQVNAPIISTPDPATFTKSEMGGYKLGPVVGRDGNGVTGGLAGTTGAQGCNVMLGVVRDFKGHDKGGHPDFEAYSGSKPTPGLVAPALGGDRKPVYTSACESNPPHDTCPYGQQMTSQQDFDAWYRPVDGVNQAYAVYFMLAPQGSIYTFQSKRFFPLDEAGLESSGMGEDNMPHNFGFTTELHTAFRYSGGEKFSFTGDDDLWVFINDRLAIDLGGLHPSASGSVDLDQEATRLGLSKGATYPLELFHAERHTTASNFRIDTTLAFVDCGTLPPDLVR